MNAESLDRLITISLASEQNSYGEVDSGAEPQTVAKVRANIRPLSGRDMWAAQQINAEASVKITIRHRADISPNMIVEAPCAKYVIKAILPSERRNSFLVLLCKELYPNG